MKDTFKDIGNPNRTKSKLDEAIDNMDMMEIEKQLDKLLVDKPFPYTIENSKLFAKKIIKNQKKGYDIMKRNSKKCGTLIASLILTITVGVTAAYATGLFEDFNFFYKNTTVEIESNQNIGEKKAKKLAEEANDSYNTPSNTKESSTETNLKIFSSIQEVKEALGIDIVLPSYIPTDFEIDKDIRVQPSYNNNYNIYTSYTSKENEEKFLGVTVISNNLPEDSTVVTVSDAVYKDDYTTPSGTQYTLLDEDSLTIAKVEINNIKYGLLFRGVSKDEMHKVIDSVDLSPYEK